MAWYQYRINFQEDKKEILNAFLISIDADAILDNEDHFICYKNNPEDSEEFKQQISHLPGVVGEVACEECEDKNWNADWEANYDPISVDDLCYIRAEFHEAKDGFPYEIIIRPEMAFGTGHHETTYQMIKMMHETDFSGTRVLDYGCGTGILSVFAAKKEAAYIKGVDIEGPAVENSFVHQEINALNDFSMDFELGGLEVLSDEKYDIVLANINRRVLLETKEGILKHLVSGGKLFMSGILATDETLITDHYSSSFDLVKKTQKGEWLCFLWESRT